MKKIFHKLKNFIYNQIDYIENVSMTPLAYMTTFLSIVLVRVFIENFSNPDQYGLYTEWSTIIAYILFYTAILLTVPIFLAPFSGKKPFEILRYSIFSSLLLLVPPIADLILTGGAGFCMGYNGAHHWALLESFFRFFGPIQDCGISLGMKIEIVILMIGVFLFCYKNTKKIWTSLLGGIMGYFLVWFHLSLPGILMTLDIRTFNSGSIEAYLTSIYSGGLFSSIHTFFAFDVPPLFNYFEFIALFTGRISLILSIVGLFIILWTYNKQKVKAFLKNIRPARIVLNLLFVGLGIKFAYWMGFINGSLSLADIFGLFTLAVVVGLNFILAVVINDRYDVAIDSHTNTERPLIQKTLTDDDMKNISYILSVFVFLGSLLFNYNIFILLLSFQLVYFLYSVPPLRLRRLFPLNSMVIGLVSVFSLLIGYFFVSQNQEIVSFPGYILVMFFIFIVSISPAKDLKDVEGDMSEGVTTLPGMIGRKKSRLITGIIMLLWMAFFIFIALSYSFTITLIFSILFICAVIGLIWSKEGERGGFILLYLLITTLIFLA